MKKTLFTLAMIATAICSFAQRNSDYEYEVECLGVELDGSQTLRIWGVGHN